MKKSTGITKEQLKALLGEGSTLQDKAKELQEKYYSKIDNLLFVVPDDTLIEGLSIWDKLPNREYGESIVWRFNEFVRNSPVAEIDKFLNTLEHSLGDLLRRIFPRDEWNRKVNKQNHKWHWGFLAAFGIITVALVIFAFLETYNVISNTFHLAEICGIIDFLNGVAFFIYEFVNDHLKKEQYKEISSNECDGGSEPSTDVSVVDSEVIRSKNTQIGVVEDNGKGSSSTSVYVVSPTVVDSEDIQIGTVSLGKNTKGNKKK